MEIFELRYFLGVARHENLHKASVEQNVSPGSLSKAITRLEQELNVSLFDRVGRHIKLTEQGHLLKVRAAQIIQIADDTKLDLGGPEHLVKIKIAGPETLLAHFGMEFVKESRLIFKHSQFEFIVCNEIEAIEKVEKRIVDFGIVTTHENSSHLKAKILNETSFLTVAGTRHPMALKLSKKAHKSVSIDEVLNHEFVGLNRPILGLVGLKQSLDGWRDDKYQRKISFQATGLRIIEELVSSNQALAYLPEYIARPYLQSKRWSEISIHDCQYTCKQKIKLITKSPIEAGWIRQIF